MIKTAFKRGLIAIPVGLMIVQLIGIGISLATQSEAYIAVDPGLVREAGNELRAVIIQDLFAAFYGFMWGAISVIWDIERWSLLKQTAVFFAIAAAVTILVAWNAYWMEHTFNGVFRYLLIFTLIFVLVWAGSYFGMRARVRKMNARLENRES